MEGKDSALRDLTQQQAQKNRVDINFKGAIRPRRSPLSTLSPSPIVSPETFFLV